MPIDEFRISVTVNAPLELVWEHLVDWKSQSNWMALTTVTSSADNGRNSGIGTDIKAFTGVGKFGILDEMKVIEWRPPTFCAVDHYGKFIKGKGKFSLVQLSSERTRFDWYEKIEAPKWVLAVIKPGILIAVRYSLRKFARTVRS